MKPLVATTALALSAPFVQKTRKFVTSFFPGILKSTLGILLWRKVRKLVIELLLTSPFIFAAFWLWIYILLGKPLSR